MGFRFNKSIRIGKNFRVNLSKSGIGYSFGVKGYRVTKTAKGNIRQTASIPGTGISYVEEHKPNKNKFNNQKPPNRSKIKIILLCILAFIFFEFIPAIVATIFLKKSNLKKSLKITFIALSWILNLFFIGATSYTNPNPNETTPVVALNEDSSTSSTNTETDTKELTTEDNSESTTSTIESSSNTTTSNISNENTTIETTTETITQSTSETMTETTTKEVITTQSITQETTAKTTITETTTQPTTKEIVTEKPTQATTQANKELTTNNVEIKTLYVGNKSNGKLHKSSCRHAKKLLPENIVQFDSRDSAIAAGYSDLCEVCNP